MGSLRSFVLVSQKEFQKSEFLNHNPRKSLNPPLTSPPNMPKQHALPFQRSKRQIASVQLTQSHIGFTPKSNLSRLSSFLLQQRSFVNILSEKVVMVLVWSIIFMGLFNTKPSMALHAQIRSSGASSEENQSKKEEKSENEVMFEKILEREPRNLEALKVILYGKMRRGKTKEAVEYVERLIDVDPEEVEWRLLQALSYEMMGQISKAKRLFNEILESRPLLLRALHGLAMVMHKNHEGPAVFEMLNKALNVAQHKKRKTEERSIKILIAQMHGELEEGLKKFQDLVNENPRDFRPYLCQGIIYSLLDKKKKAAEQFEIYQSLVPEEFPQRGFLDDVVLAAKTKPQEKLQNEFES
ncbi:protein SLOW GREEN 1, chloroplastic isoform X2 [Carica papaya]|uniref:protein SLOW GREEN 1, chloroplastic isoform X2 n=1 Tax=Carica papaya TaxID=3649 RepID=UPI000B8CA263|nr:protein SLOW GREEN 1, chloroplastic isoform X2 [Carica papaya]